LDASSTALRGAPVARWAFLASRTFWIAGSSRPIRIAMMAITTSSSMRVKPPSVRAPWRRGKRVDMWTSYVLVGR
jgi:hypothetical protein